uniref:Uncharacterized protein n=1 Tax=Rhizophora mucronata TaxID=61149 RepID=A0A2P2MRJ6_RHIMU
MNSVILKAFRSALTDGCFLLLVVFSCLICEFLFELAYNISFVI